VGASGDEKDWYHVVVCKHNGLNVGLVVDEIVDIVDHHLSANRHNEVVMGVAIIQDQVTEILNLQKIINSLDIECFESEGSSDETVGYA
jgi:chemotaxis signal transduction protein